MTSQEKMDKHIKWYSEFILAARDSGDTNEQKEQYVRASMRHLIKTDLFYLMIYGLNRIDVKHPWLYERCLEIQKDPNERLDLWSREHYKSTLITFGKTIQDILCDPEITVGIFSHTKSISRGFLKQIQYELENNIFLQTLFPDILWDTPRSECIAAGVSWSTDKGITVKRKTNPAVCTVEAHGLVDSQPTGKHFSLLIYDDLVTLESVSTPDQINKTTNALLLSYNLGAHGGHRRFIGTRYHAMDTYQDIIDKGTVEPRIHICIDDIGNPVLLTKEALDKKRRDFGPFIWATQMLQNPLADNLQGFKKEWLRLHRTSPNHMDMNRYILVDSANEKKKTSDFTSMMVVGLSMDGNYYILDMVRDRLNLTERSDVLFDLHQKWEPIAVGYEKYGIMADIQHIEYVQDIKGYHYMITPLGGSMPKNDRIKRLIPLFEQGRIWMPEKLDKISYEGRVENLIDIFIKTEYLNFPVSQFDDCLDCLARILDKDLNAVFPLKGRFNQGYKVRQKRSMR